MAMLPDAPHVLLALEEGVGALVRQSSWAYPAANIGHVVALTLFAGAVAVMDLRLLNAIRGGPLLALVRPARRAAALAFAAMLVTGGMLFVAEASHVAANSVFQVKALLIFAALVNAAVAGRSLARLQPGTVDPTPALRRSAMISMALWLGVAACGRLIAYV